MRHTGGTMRIIVEGPDGGGKTRLVNDLLLKFEPAIQPTVSFKKSDFTQFTKWLVFTLAIDYDSVPIHDRFFYSELVYGRIIRNRVDMPELFISDMKWELPRETLLIYARPDMDTLLKGARVEDQMEGVEEKFTELVEAYDTLMLEQRTRYNDRFYRYNWKDSREPDAVVKHVQRYLAGELR
jgi:thymidylate kinase